MIKKINDENLSNMLDEFARLKDVEGILLAGSRAVKADDNFSDYDVYIYVNKDIEVSVRKEITDKYCEYMELDNCFWETEDDGILKDSSIQVEIIYRDLKWINDSLNRTIIKCEANVGYTTCFWANIKNSILLYDRNGELSKLKSKCNVKYPLKLKKNIIKKNYPLLKMQMPAYYNQIEKALKREDFISVNHRIAALLASYFDIIFAINETLHPGEKKLLKIIREKGLKVPKDMETNVNNILKFSADSNSKILQEIDVLVYNLDVLLKQEGLWTKK